MAERTTTITTGRGTSTFTTTVKKGTSDTTRRPRRDAATKRFHNNAHTVNGAGPYMLLMDPNALKIKKIK